MKRDLAFALVWAGMGAASAQTPANRLADPPAKVGVVQFHAAVTATSEFQRDFGALQKKFEPRRTEVKNLSDEVDRLTKQLEADGAKLSEAEQETRARAIESKKRQAQRTAEDAQTEFEQASQELFNRVAAKLGDELTKYAAEHGYTLVVDRSEQQDETPAVLWASPSDITQPIVDGYNAKSGVAAPGGATAPPAGPRPSVPR